MRNPNTPIPTRPPAGGFRVGIDRSPVDLDDPDDRRWLLACVWPDTGRLERTAAALDLARRHRPTVQRGDMVDDLPQLLERSGANCVITTWAFAYLSPPERERFVEHLADAARTRPVAWISAEAPGVVDLLEPPSAPVGTPNVLGLVVFDRATVSASVLGLAHSHGAWLDWQPIQRDEGRHLYGLDPAAYDRGRPPYPSRVWEILTDRCGLRPGTRVLEIGPGTGLATRELLNRGAHVTAVEPDPDLAGHLVASLRGHRLDLHQTAFEQAHLPEGIFDLVVAATSFHWVDQALSLPKLSRVLRPGGWAGIWWTLFVVPGEVDAFQQRVDTVLGKVDSTRNQVGRPQFELDTEHRCQDLEERAGLTDARSERIPWTARLNPTQVRALYGTMAVVLRRSPEEQTLVLDAIEDIGRTEFAGDVERNFLTVVYTARYARP